MYVKQEHNILVECQNAIGTMSNRMSDSNMSDFYMTLI